MTQRGSRAAQDEPSVVDAAQELAGKVEVTTPEEQLANQGELAASQMVAASSPGIRKLTYSDPRMEPNTTYTSTVPAGGGQAAREVDVKTNSNGRVTTDDPDEQAVMAAWGFVGKEA